MLVGIGHVPPYPALTFITYSFLKYLVFLVFLFIIIVARLNVSVYRSGAHRYVQVMAHKGHSVHMEVTCTFHFGNWFLSFCRFWELH